MVYRGRPPKDEAFTDSLTPGRKYTVQIQQIKDMDSGDYLVILECQDGEIGYFTPWNLTPPPEGATKEEKKKNRAWVFWRLAGAFDWPTQGYWETPEDQREECEWDVIQVLETIKAMRSTAMIEVGEYRDKKTGKMRPTVDGIWSPRRKPELGQKAPKDTLLDTETPF